MSKIALEELLFPFKDLAGQIYDLQKQQGSFKLDLTPILHSSQFNLRIGGTEGLGFILLNSTSNNHGVLYFSQGLEGLFPDFHLFKKSCVEYGQLSFERDFSYRLQLRNNFLKLCAFEDEAYDFSLMIDNEVVPGSFKSSLINSHGKGVEFISSYPKEVLNQKLQNGKLTVVVKNKSYGHLRSFIEEELSIDKTWNDCWSVFYKLIKHPHYYEHNFSYFNEVLFRFKITKELSADSSDFLKQINNLSKEKLNHLDFFDWNELIFCFSVAENFSKVKRAVRIQAFSKIELLKKEALWPFKKPSGKNLFK